jgi:hypothetical protein
MYFTEQIINYSEKSNDNFLCKISKIGSVQFDLLGLTRKLCPIQQIMKTDYPEDYWCVIGEKTKKGSYSRIDFMQKDHALIVSNPFMGVKGKLNGSNVVFGERNCSFISDNNVVKVIRGLPLHLEDSLNYVETSEGYITLEIPAGTDERLNPNKADVFLIQSLFRKQSPAP